MANAHLRRIDGRSSELVAAYYPLVQRIARRMAARLPSGIDVDELVSPGVIGLIEAVERYDPSRGIAFEPYAKHRIQGAILDALRAMDWVPRAVRQRGTQLEETRRTLTRQLGRPPTAREIADRLGVEVGVVHALIEDAAAQAPVSLDAPSEPGESLPVERVAGGEDPESTFARDEQRHAATMATAGLPERERLAIEMFYFEDRSLKEIAAVLGVTDSRVSQLCAQGIKRLRLVLDPPPEA
jgi:RNA polymerase sigma factor FliA